MLVHPSCTNLKKEVAKHLLSKRNKWDPRVEGIVTGFTNMKLLNGARGFIMDDSPMTQYQISYDVSYLKPKVGVKVKAVINEVQQGNISLTIDKVLTAIVQT